jgi:hypothetical protein
MVHRSTHSPDSRLLSSLIGHEKDYIKHFNSLIESSNLSLTSLSAFAAASPPPFSNVILAITSSLAGADEAFKRYIQSLEQWRIYLTELRDLEDDIARISKDKEILYVLICFLDSVLVCQRV